MRYAKELLLVGRHIRHRFPLPGAPAPAWSREAPVQWAHYFVFSIACIGADLIIIACIGTDFIGNFGGSGQEAPQRRPREFVAEGL